MGMMGGWCVECVCGVGGGGDKERAAPRTRPFCLSLSHTHLFRRDHRAHGSRPAGGLGRRPAGGRWRGLADGAGKRAASGGRDGAAPAGRQGLGGVEGHRLCVWV